VETTCSTVDVISNILKKKTPVVMLGSDFDDKVNLDRSGSSLKKMQPTSGRNSCVRQRFIAGSSEDQERRYFLLCTAAC
jgi:hypothetical protein